MKGGVIVVKQPPLYFSKDKPEELELRITAPPLLRRAFGGDVERLVHHLRREARRLETEYRRERAREKKTVLGAARVKRIHPWSEPRTPRERRGRPIPRFKVGGNHDEDPRRVRAKSAAEVRGFWDDDAGALEQWCGGDRAVCFPYGSYRMPTLHRASVAEPLEGAILCAPGDVSGAASWVNTDAVGEGLRAKVIEAANERVDDLRERTEVSSADAPAEQDATAVELESPARSAERPHPKRTVTLRDRRRRKKKRGKPALP